MKLTETQKSTRDILVKKIVTGEYKQIKNPCLCGKQHDVTLAEKDRFDIPVKIVLCKECGLVRSDPYYDSNSLSNFYQKEYRLLYTGSEEANRSFFYEQKIFGDDIYDYLVKNFFHEDIKNKKVFEIGCGAGGILKAFKDRGNQVYGCDYGEKYVDFGKDQGLTLTVGGSSGLLPYGKADIIILNHVLEHMTDVRKEISEISNLLSPTGILYIALPGIYSIHDTYKGRFVEGYLQNAHVWYFTLKTLTETMNRFGFYLNTGDETIMSIFTAKSTELTQARENPEKVLKYLRKTRWLKWYYILKKTSLTHLFVETFKNFSVLYKPARWIYRKIKTNEK